MIEISPEQAVDALDDGALLVDIRDALSFGQQHIRGSRHLDNLSLEQFIADVPCDTPLIVCCYHGLSSRDAAAFLQERGYASALSLQGGFEHWRQAYPDTLSSAET